MSFCFGYICNDEALAHCAIQAFAAPLHLEQGAPAGWGISYYQAGQPMVVKRPRAAPGPLDFVAQAERFQTSVMLGNVRPPHLTSLRPEDTQPFRYRNWTFCHAGAVDQAQLAREELLEAIPEFICRNIRGRTDSEHIFHLFLSFLNDTGRLDDPRVPPDVVGRTLHATFAFLDRISRDRKVGSPGGSCILTNGSFLVGLRREGPLAVALQGGFDCPDASGREVPRGHLRAALMVAGPRPLGSAPWEEVPPGALIAVDARVSIMPLPTT